MGSMTMRDISDDLEQRLRMRAAEHGHSIEEEARAILRESLAEYAPPANLASAIHDRFAPLGGVELRIPSREPMRDGVVLDLRYEARDIDRNITSQGKIDQWFEVKTQGLTDVAKAQSEY